MRCPDCGTEVPADASFCVRCGRQISNAPFVSSHRMMGTKQVATSAGSEHKTLVLIAAIVAVVIVIPIVLAAILYVMVLGFGGDENYTPVAYLVRTTGADGYKFTFTQPSSDLYWSDVTIQLGDGEDYVSWDPSSDDLDQDPFSTKSYAWRELPPGIRIWLNVTDVQGNGRIDSGDYFVLAASPGFSSGWVYEVTVLFLRNGAQVCQTSFVV